MYYAKHIFGILLVFVFIMLEGGWSFDKKEDDKAPTDWSSGNVIDTLTISTMIYSAFIFTSKSKLFYNLAFFALAFTIYLINTQRQYWVDRKSITPELDNKFYTIESAKKLLEKTGYKDSNKILKLLGVNLKDKGFYIGKNTTVNCDQVINTRDDASVESVNL